MSTQTVTDVMYECDYCCKVKDYRFAKAMVPCIISFRWIGAAIEAADVKQICLKRSVGGGTPEWVEKYREESQVKLE